MVSGQSGHAAGLMASSSKPFQTPRRPALESNPGLTRVLPHLEKGVIFGKTLQTLAKFPKRLRTTVIGQSVRYCFSHFNFDGHLPQEFGFWTHGKDPLNEYRFERLDTLIIEFKDAIAMPLRFPTELHRPFTTA